MNDLYLIGNGFDLAHGLKTSYKDFILWYFKDTLSKIMPNRLYEDDLMHFRRIFSDQLHDHDNISSLLEECGQLQIEIKYKHDFFRKIVESAVDYNWVDIEYEYYQALVGAYKSVNNNINQTVNDFEKIVVRINKCLEAIQLKLVDYLVIINDSQKSKDPGINNIILEGTGVLGIEDKRKLLLNFNYTSTISMYLNSHFFKANRLINIHGEIGNDENPIIFGYGDEIDPYYEKIEQYKSNSALDHIKAFGYFKTDNYQKLLKFIDSDEFVVKILGHSCGLSDRILLNTIFEHSNCKAIKIYYHKKNEIENDFVEKTQEISRHFQASGKGDMRRKIVSFKKSQPLSQ